MVQLQMLGADGTAPQFQAPARPPAVQLPDRSAENISAAQASMSRGYEATLQAIATTSEAYGNSALATARQGARRLDTFNGIVGAIGEGVDLYNRIQQSRLEGMQEAEAAALRRRVLEQVTTLRDQFGQSVASGMSEIEARNLMRDGFIALRTDINRQAEERNLGGAFNSALAEAYQIVSDEVNRTLDQRNQAQLSQFEELRESALGVYQEQMSALVNPMVVRLASVYTNPNEVQNTLKGIDQLVGEFAEQRGLSPIETLSIQRSLYQSANQYLTQRGVRIVDLENQSQRIEEAWGLLTEAYNNYYDPENEAAYQQGRILEATIGVIENQYPDVELGRLINSRSPLFEQQQALEAIRLGEALNEAMAAPEGEDLLNLSADAFDYLQYSFAFAYAFPGAIETDYSVAQVEALGRRDDNPVIRGWVETGQNLRQARNAYTELRNREVRIQATIAQREAQAASLLDRLYPQRMGEFTTLNQQLNFLINVPEAAGVTERGSISRETVELFQQWYAEDLDAQIQILQNDAVNLQSEWLRFGIDLGDPAGTARRLTEWGNRTATEREAARMRVDRQPIQPPNPNSPFINGVPQGYNSAPPSFLQGRRETQE